MSIDPVSPTDEVLTNPYAAPGADLASPGLDLSDDLVKAEAIRRAHIRHEAAVKSVGSLFLLCGVVFSIAAVALLLLTAAFIRSGVGKEARLYFIITLLALIFSVAISILYLSVGVGLRKLQPWARWTTVGLLSLGLAGMLLNILRMLLAVPSPEVIVGTEVGLLIVWGVNGFMLYIMLASKSPIVFSHDYRLIISKTSHVKYRPSKVVVILLVVLFVVSIVIAGSVTLDGLMNR